MNAFNLQEAYAAVYNEDLREDILSVEEDFSFIDDLSDNQLDLVMEEILSEGVDLSECFEIFEELIVEMNPYAPAGSKESKAYAKSTTKSKRSAEASERRAARVERIKGAAKRAGEAVKSRASEVKKSAVGGVKAAQEKVSGKLSSAKEKIKGFLGKVGSAAKAGASAAKKEFSGESGKEAKARTTGRQMRRAARQQASAERSKDTSAFEKPKAKVGTPENPRIGKPAAERKALPQAKTKTATVSRRTAAAAKLAKAAAGTGPSTTQQGQPAGTFKSKKSRSEAQKREARLTAAESLELLDILVQDMISEGLVCDIYEAYDVIENLDITETYKLVEDYLTEEVETVDLYDVVLEHLLDEGYADTEEEATVIMANMSEEWREEILDEAGRMHSSSEQQVGFARIKSGESGGRGKKPMSDSKISSQPGGQAFLDKIKKTKADPKYKN